MEMTKKVVFWVSLLGGVSCFLLSGTKMLNFWCGMYNYDCQDHLDLFSDYLLLFLPIFFFSIITYFLKEPVFRTWLRFTYWYTPFYILVILLLSDRVSTGWSMGSIFNSEFFAITLSGIFVIISLVLVIYKAISIKNK